MSDARSLLRAQRAARRIEHPHAQYTDSGKLTCIVCREAIKSEGLWETHTRSASHRQRSLALQKAKARPQQQPTSPTNNGGVAPKPKSSTDTLSDEALLAQIIAGNNSGSGHKRKHGEDSDVEMADPAAGEGVDGAYEDDGPDGVRRKRSKHDIGSLTTVAAASTDSAGMFSPSTVARNGSPMKTDTPVGTPPGLVRRSSGTPSHGVELQIPSRPATPSASQASSTSTPKATPIGRSPLIPQEGQLAASSAGAPSKQGPKAHFVTSVTSAAINTTTTTTVSDTPHSINSTIATIAVGGESTTSVTGGGGGGAADDDDWAAFEAEVVNAAPPTTTTVVPTLSDQNTNSDAVISAAPLTAEQIAAKSEEDEHAKRRAAAEVELEDEQEEAKRALEAEFEEMEELEARVRKLKEKREAIRRGSVPSAPAPAAEIQRTVVNGASDDVEDNSKEEEEDSDDDDDLEEDDDWSGFRFRR